MLQRDGKFPRSKSDNCLLELANPLGNRRGSITSTDCYTCVTGTGEGLQESDDDYESMWNLLNLS